MVFGTTYCAISRLPIYDGDACLMIPLAFHLSTSFKDGDTPEDMFIGLYHFADQPQPVIYGGNPSRLTYSRPDGTHGNRGRPNYNQYILVRTEVFDWIVAHAYMPDSRTCSFTLDGYHFLHFVREAADRFRDDEKLTMLRARINDPQAEVDFRLKRFPDWMLHLQALADFMLRMGIPLAPAYTADQHDTFTKYQQMLAECMPPAPVQEEE